MLTSIYKRKTVSSEKEGCHARHRKNESAQALRAGRF